MHVEEGVEYRLLLLSFCLLPVKIFLLKYLLILYE